MKKKLDPQKEHEKKVEEATDLITTEDCVENVVLAAHATSCPDDHSEDALFVLGASVYDDDICDQKMV